MELKLGIGHEFFDALNIAFNRTTMELKLIVLIDRYIQIATFNRTTMELKPWLGATPDRSASDF